MIFCAVDNEPNGVLQPNDLLKVMLLALLAVQVDVILYISLITRNAAATSQCSQAVSSKYSHRLFGFEVIQNRKTADLNGCFTLCRKTSGCRSLNYRIDDGVCELNNKNHFTHPKNLKECNGYVYLPVLDIIKDPETVQPEKPIYKTCAKIKEMKPSSLSGVYELKVNGSSKSVYCDMDNFEGGWSLVVSISGSNNQHILRAHNNCFNSSLCVPLVTGTLVARKNSDTDIRALAIHEGTFRVDVTSTNSRLFTVFYQFPKGAIAFDAGCKGAGCPRMIISHSYPYIWESSTCSGKDKGYPLSTDCYRVFDSHDNSECGAMWFSSQYSSKRVLYSYCLSTGIYNGLQGFMYVR